MMNVALDATSGAEDMMTLTEAARAIPLPRSTAYLECIRGNLASRLVAGRFLISREDVEAYKAARLSAKESGR